MKKFLAIFTCAENSKNHEAWKQLDEQTQKERLQKGMQGWQDWVTKYKSQVVYEGGPLGKTKRADSKGIHDIDSLMGAFVIVQASSHEEAAKMFLEHPHFSIFPGDAVEIMERLDVPRS